MKIISILAVLIFSAASFAQEPGKEFYNAKYKWTIKIPEGYANAPYEDTDYDETERLIFIVQNVDEDYMEATDSPYNSAEDGDYAEVVQFVAEMMKEGLEAQMEGTKVDLVSVKEKIGNRDFFHDTFIVTYPGIDFKLQLHIFNALFDDINDFSMTISYVDDIEGEKMLKAFRESRFK